MKIQSPETIHIRTYEDVWWKLNRERTLHFELVEGEMSAEVVNFLRERLPSAWCLLFSPLLMMQPTRFRSSTSMPFGRGCEGQLQFSDNGVYYNASNSDHSRFWPMEDIESLGPHVRIPYPHYCMGALPLREHQEFPVPAQATHGWGDLRAVVAESLRTRILAGRLRSHLTVARDSGEIPRTQNCSFLLKIPGTSLGQQPPLRAVSRAAKTKVTVPFKQIALRSETCC